MDSSEVVAIAEALQPRDQVVFDIHQIPLCGSIFYGTTERWAKIIPVALVVVIEISEFLCEAAQGIRENREVFPGLDDSEPDSDIFDSSDPLLPDARRAPEEDCSRD